MDNEDTRHGDNIGRVVPHDTGRHSQVHVIQSASKTREPCDDALWDCTGTHLNGLRAPHSADNVTWPLLISSIVHQNVLHQQQDSQRLCICLQLG